MIAYLKTGDLRPVFRAQLTEDEDPVNLAGCTVRLLARRRDGTLAIDEAMTIEGDGTTGIVSYTWETADTANPGDLDCEITVTDVSSKPATYPQDGYFQVTLMPSLAPAPA